jgi:hypothetical protein
LLTHGVVRLAGRGIHRPPAGDALAYGERHRLHPGELEAVLARAFWWGTLNDLRLDRNAGCA